MNEIKWCITNIMSLSFESWLKKMLVFFPQVHPVFFHFKMVPNQNTQNGAKSKHSKWCQIKTLKMVPNQNTQNGAKSKHSAYCNLACFVNYFTIIR